MVARVIPVESFDLVVFGATGDLARRKILPGLFRRLAAGQMPEGARIIGAARSDMKRADFQKMVGEALDEFDPKTAANKALRARFLDCLHYVQLDVATPAGWKALAKQLRADVVRAFYLSVSPSLFGVIAAGLNEHGLATAQSRIVVEKPLGHDLASARALNAQLSTGFGEGQIYRIDHYLGKETVQNLMALRFANALFEPVWRAGHIDHVQISVCETLGVENRGGYYDKAGAMRDMIQNHLLQLLCLVAMEAPVRFDADAVRNEKVKILEALKPISGLDVQDKTVRGQYTAGKIGGHDVPAYYFEKNVDNDSDTETFAAVQVEIDNWRWAGVPFYLRTGKRLAKKASEILIQFKPVPHRLFHEGEANQLLIRLQPEERISLQLMAKNPGKGMHLKPVELDLNLANAFNQQRRWDAYERLLLDVIEGDSTLFMRRDEVEAAWQWVDPILQGWLQHYQSPRPYPAGSDGPEQLQHLLERHGRHWAE